MPYEPWMLAAIDQAGYNGIQDDHIDAVAEEILCTGITEASGQDFDTACRPVGRDSRHSQYHRPSARRPWHHI